MILASWAFILPNFFLGGSDGRRLITSTADRPAELSLSSAQPSPHGAYYDSELALYARRLRDGEHGGAAAAEPAELRDLSYTALGRAVGAVGDEAQALCPPPPQGTARPRGAPCSCTSPRRPATR